jgi:hypothetical protein
VPLALLASGVVASAGDGSTEFGTFIGCVTAARIEKAVAISATLAEATESGASGPDTRPADAGLASDITAPAGEGGTIFGPVTGCATVVWIGKVAPTSAALAEVTNPLQAGWIPVPAPPAPTKFHHDSLERPAPWMARPVLAASRVHCRVQPTVSSSYRRPPKRKSCRERVLRDPAIACAWEGTISACPSAEHHRLARHRPCHQSRPRAGCRIATYPAEADAGDWRSGCRAP